MLKSFTLKSVVRIILLMASMVGLSLILGDRRLLFSQFILGTLIAVQIWELIRFVNRTNRELTRFLLAIKHADFNINFKKSGEKGSFPELQDAFAEVIGSFENLRLGEEASEKFMEHLVNHMPLGVMARKGEEIILSNKAAEQILSEKEIRSWKILKQNQSEFCEYIESVDSGSTILDFAGRGSLLIDKSLITIVNERHELIIFRDISQEMEEKELESWLRLIRILTHEIMNSSTPIVSLTQTMQSMLEKDGKEKTAADLDDSTIEDIRFSLETIRKRSEYMLGFVKDYRELTRVPRPKKQNIEVHDLVQGLERLYQSELVSAGITLETSGLDFEIFADQGLIEQVLINLTTNAIYALKDQDNPKIRVSGTRRENRAELVYEDNGRGISEKELQDIFIPFYTTREGGSGIGLSLSKQIMYLHNGSLRVESREGHGTKFTLNFPYGT